MPEYYTRELELSINFKVFSRITLASACEGNCSTYYASCVCIPLTKTAARNEAALSYHKVRGLYFLAVVFAATIVSKHINFFFHR